MVKSSLSVRVALRYVSWGCLWVAAANLGVDVLLKGHGHHDYSDVLVDLLQMFPIALVMFFLLSRELSARQQAESARLVSEQQLANILKTAPSAIIGADETGQILLFNPGAERIFKYRAREVLGKSISELVPDLFDGVCHPDQERGTAAAAASAFAQRQVTGRRADDTHFAAEVSVSELIQDEGSLLTIVLNDISRRRAAEDEIIRSRELLEIRVSERTEALHRERDRLTRILDAMPDGIIMIDSKYGILYTNPALRRDFGPAATRKCYEYLRKRQEPCPGCDGCADISGDTVRCEWFFPENGKTYDVISTTVAAAGGGTARLGILRDISARRAAEVERERLRNEVDSQHRLLQTVLHNATSGIAVFDGVELRLRWANAKYCQFVSALWGSADITGRRLEEIIPDAEANGITRIFRQVASTGNPHFDPEYELTGSARGTTYWQWSLLPLSAGKSDASDLMIFVTEVTDQVLARRRTEQLSAESERRAAELQQAYRELEMRTRELATLLDIAHKVGSTLELQPLLELILDQLKSVIDYTGAAIFTADEAGATVVAYRGPAPQVGIIGRRSSMEKMPGFRRISDRREPVIIDDLNSDSPLAREFRQQAGEDDLQWLWNTRSLIEIPIMTKESVIGSLRLDHRQPRYFSSRHCELAMAIANQAAVALVNARLYREARKVAVLEERARLARELHDSVSQAIYGMALSTQAAEEMLRTDSRRAAETLANVRILARGALSEMRSLIFNLRPVTLEAEGLSLALSKLADAARASCNDVSLDLCPDEGLSLEVKENLYRICQEALWNIIKHARAKTIAIRVERNQTHALLEVHDDGIGFDPEGSFPGHFGLSSMRERAAALGGTVEIESARGRGARVRSRIPLVPQTIR